MYVAKNECGLILNYVEPKHTLNWVGAEGGVYFFWTSGGGLRVGTGFDTEGGYRGGTLSKKKISKWP